VRHDVAERVETLPEFATTAMNFGPAATGGAMLLRLVLEMDGDVTMRADSAHRLLHTAYREAGGIEAYNIDSVM